MHNYYKNEEKQSDIDTSSNTLYNSDRYRAGDQDLLSRQAAFTIVMQQQITAGETGMS